MERMVSLLLIMMMMIEMMIRLTILFMSIVIMKLEMILIMTINYVNGDYNVDVYRSCHDNDELVLNLIKLIYSVKIIL